MYNSFEANVDAKSMNAIFRAQLEARKMFPYNEVWRELMRYRYYRFYV